MLFGDGLSRPLVLAADCLADQVNPGGETGLIVAISEKRFDVVLGNVERGDVRQGAFETVTDLNKHLAILDEDEERNAIAALFLTHAPRLCHALGVICDIRVTLQFRKNRDHDLVGGFPLELRELLVETLGDFLGNDARVIVEVTVRFRRNHFRGLRMKCQQRGKRRDATRDFFHVRICSGSRVGCNLAADTPAATARSEITFRAMPSLRALERACQS